MWLYVVTAGHLVSIKTDQSPPANISKQTETRTRISHQSSVNAAAAALAAVAAAGVRLVS